MLSIKYYLKLKTFSKRNYSVYGINRIITYKKISKLNETNRK